MAAISACIDSWNWEDLLVSGPVPFSSPVPSIGNQTLPSLFRSTSRPRLPFSLSSSPRFRPPSCHKRLLATLPGPLSLHCSQIARASLGPLFHRGGLHLRSCRFRVEDFERTACQDIDEKNDIPARSREWILQRTALEREKKLRISPLFAFVVGLLRRNNVAVSFVDSEHRRCLSKSFPVLRNDRCI